MAGVYCLKHSLRQKAQGYGWLVPLFDDGTFWGARWELSVDRNARVDRAFHKTDQWVQPQMSVHLMALHIQAMTVQELSRVPGDYNYTMSWDPFLRVRTSFSIS